jgi:hypothetical protein
MTAPAVQAANGQAGDNMRQIGDVARGVLARMLARLPAEKRRAILDGMGPAERAAWEQLLRQRSA